jgi:hypothetical protein
MHHVQRPTLGPFVSKFLSLWLESKAKELMVHIDNAPAHNSRITGNLFEDNSLKKLPHPPYLPGIFPSDLYFLTK